MKQNLGSVYWPQKTRGVVLHVIKVKLTILLDFLWFCVCDYFTCLKVINPLLINSKNASRFPTLLHGNKVCFFYSTFLKFSTFIISYSYYFSYLLFIFKFYDYGSFRKAYNNFWKSFWTVESEIYVFIYLHVRTESKTLEIRVLIKMYHDLNKKV